MDGKTFKKRVVPYTDAPNTEKGKNELPKVATNSKPANQKEHSGHRERVKERFRKEGGIAHFSDREILELILFYCIPQGDVNPIANALLEAFGSLQGVLSADYDALLTTKGMRNHSVLLLKLFIPVVQESQVRIPYDRIDLSSPSKVAEYAFRLLYGTTVEQPYLLCLNTKAELIDTIKMDTGTETTATQSLRKLVEKVLFRHVNRVILIHNHPNGTPQPSKDDDTSTKLLFDTLMGLGIILEDHVIIGTKSDAYFSYKQAGSIQNISFEKKPSN